MNANTPPILVTGAGRGVGAHLVERLLADGHAVLAHYRSKTEAIDQLRGNGADALAADFADAARIQAFAEAIRQRYGELRAIVHNASGFAPTAADCAQAATQFQGFFTTHMLAPFLLNRALAPLLYAGDGPADIVHITDIYADNPAPEYDSYCATKAGLQNLALSFAKSLAPEIAVNVIQPGPIDFSEWHDRDTRQRILAATPLRRTGGAEAIYQALRTILANDYMTGAVIAVDGGRRLG